MAWWTKKRSAPPVAVASSTVEPLPFFYGIGAMSSEINAGQTDRLSGDAAKVDGAAMHMFRLAHGGTWRHVAPTGGDVKTFVATDFALLDPAGKLRDEILKWIDVQHGLRLPAHGKLGVQFGTNMAIGAPTDAVNGPRAQTTGAIDPTLTFASRAVNATYGVDPMPFADVNSSGEASYRYNTAPWGAYDATLADGVTPCGRFHVWLEQDLEAMDRFFEEDCEVEPSSPTAEYREAHKRRIHFPWVQPKSHVAEASMEYSRGLESAAVYYPDIGDAGQITLVGTINASATTWSWSGTPPSTGTAGDQWNPWINAGSYREGQGAVIIYDVTDPANLYEVCPFTRIDTNAGGTSGTITIQAGGRGAFGPLARSWTQSGSNIRIAMAQWQPLTGTGKVNNKWVGTPGVSGAQATYTTRKIARTGTTAADYFALSDYATCIPVRVHNLTAFLSHAYKARADAAGGATVVWPVGDRQPSSSPSITGAENAPLPSTHTFDGTETEQELENIVVRSWAEHARVAEFMSAAKFPQHRTVLYLGTALDSVEFYRWDGSAATKLTKAWVEGLAATPTIPTNGFMAQNISRLVDSGGTDYEYPAVWKSAKAYWSLSDYLFHACALPHLIDPDLAGWDTRWAHGVTHVKAGDNGDGTFHRPWEVDPQDYGAWHLLKTRWGSHAPLMFQMKGDTGSYIGDGAGLGAGAQMVRTCEDIWAYDDPSVRPVVYEGVQARYSATGTFSAAYVPSGALAGGWPGSVNTSQQNYLLGTTNATPSLDTAEAASAVGRRIRSAPSTVTQVR